MKRNFKYLYILVLLCSFIPKVYAFNYDISLDVLDTSVLEGTETEINVSLNNVQGTSNGIKTCSLDILFNKNINLISPIKVMDNFRMVSGKKYIFEASSSVVRESLLFTIPIKINDVGNVKLTDIVCSDGSMDVFLNDKEINFIIGEEDNSSSSEEYYYSYDLENIRLSDGDIRFDKSINEYNVSVNDFSTLEVYLSVSDGVSAYNISKVISGSEKKIIISINSNNNDLLKVYTIYVNEINNKEHNLYIPIFILILCILLLINIIRIVRKRKKI